MTKLKRATAFENARGFVEKQVAEAPNDAGRHAQLGLIYAALGRKEDAIREGKRAVELLPESKDAFEGPEIALGARANLRLDGRIRSSPRFDRALAQYPGGRDSSALEAGCGLGSAAK